MQETIARSSISSKVRVPIREIDDDKAVLIGAEFIGEGIIYATAVAVLVMETVLRSDPRMRRCHCQTSTNGTEE